MTETDAALEPDPGTAARPERVRVTAPRSGEPLSLDPVSGASEAAAGVLVASLIRSQLRLAVLCTFGFVITIAGIAIVASLPALTETLVAGVPASWIVLAFGAYPPLVAIAAIAVLAATRTEAQYRALARADSSGADR